MGLGGFERNWRREWMRAIGKWSAGPAVATVPDWDVRPWSVLFMRTQGIGDLILATGVLRAIAGSHSTIALDVLTTRAAAPVLEHNPSVRRVHVMGKTADEYLPLVRALRREQYDVVIDGKITRGASFIRSPTFTMALRAPYRIGVGGGNHASVFNLCVARFDRSTTHMVEGSAALAAPFGICLDTTDFRPRIHLTDDERCRAHAQWNGVALDGMMSGARWLVNLSAGAPARRWPNDRWIALIAHLRALEPCTTIGVMGTAADWDSVRHVAFNAGAAAMPAPKLRDALALVATSGTVVTADTSITHAASAFNIPTVLLLQQGLNQWRSWNTPSEIAAWTGSTIQSLEVETACAALERRAAPDSRSVRSYDARREAMLAR